jgi:nitroreductase
MDQTDEDAWSDGSAKSPGSAWLECLGAAVLAPSLLNTQPWRFHVQAGGVDVFADLSRRLEAVDPRGREMVLSVGAAIFNLRVAMLAHGRQPLVAALPQPEQEDLLARVTLGPPVQPDQTVRALDQAISRRRTSRQPFADVSIPAEVLADLAAAAQVEGGGLAVADDIGRMLVLGLVRRADQKLRADPSYPVVLARWTGQEPGGYEGVSPEEFGPWSALEELPLRDFGLVHPSGGRQQVHFESKPTIAVLYTTGDTANDWLQAGQALERVLLTATARGLSATPLTQPLEIPELRERLSDPRDGRIVAQVVLRLGYGPPAPPPRRRPLSEVLI